MELLETYSEYVNEMAAKIRQRKRDTEPETPEQERRRIERNAIIKQARAKLRELRARDKEEEIIQSQGEEVTPPPVVPDPTTSAGKKEEEIRKKDPILKNTPNEEICRTIAGDFYWFLRNKGDQERIFIEDDFTSVTKEFRNLGKWGTTIDIDMDDEDEQDYEDDEYQVWSPGEHEKYLKLFRTFVKGKDWEKLVRPILDIGRKKWAYFKIEIK